ncbi:oxidoreductase, zinc-binding dehydrogenase family protein [Bacteriovorax sp. BSW11_IV]|uniref:NADP-dependent oxidoreductase n=1 Tax=Bacteriovorax sp. BSW11_IV TaxID=1353529 RepID=UPI00038A2CCF|nr:NADP-dependent oxidoreductase [Bacteriovorax sp. BSW11_IV]EQC48469.1 oxidoreductase, zinc-binding dehydrogenase family protein [Bacteriovorax sp. BSW11_IV]
MKVMKFFNYGLNSDSQQMFEEIPRPQKGEVVVKNYSSSINPLDWKIKDGHLREILPLQLPFALGWDFAGTVTEVGEDVTDFKVGDRVFGMIDINPNSKGTYGEYVIVSSSGIAHAPKKAALNELGAYPLAALTAWQSLTTNGQLKSGDHVLIHAGAGGVGHFAVQIAKSLGAHVVATGSSNNVDLIKSFGADKVIDYKNSNFEDQGEIFDMVLDPVGDENSHRSLKVLKEGGRLVTLLGVSEKLKQEAQEKNISTFHTFVSPISKDLEMIANLIDSDQLNAYVSDTFSLDEIDEALKKNSEGRTTGKIIVNIFND